MPFLSTGWAHGKLLYSRVASRGWSFASAVPGLNVPTSGANLTLDSGNNSYVLLGASFVHKGMGFNAKNNWYWSWKKSYEHKDIYVFAVISIGWDIHLYVVFLARRVIIWKYWHYWDNYHGEHLIS
ncbi:hypothetical protein Tco_0224074 [Tanacetum coccineum]